MSVKIIPDTSMIFAPDVDAFKIYHLISKHSTNMKTMAIQMNSAGIHPSNIVVIQPVSIPNNMKKSDQNKLETWNHLQMWKAAIADGGEGAMFLRSNVSLVTNFKSNLQSIFGSFGISSIDMIWLDASIPKTHSPSQSPFHFSAFLASNSTEPYGYFLSKDALGHAIFHMNRTGPNQWPSLHSFLLFISKRVEHLVLETMPRLCIQNTFETEDYVISYLKQYRDRYHFSVKVRAEVTRLLKRK